MASVPAILVACVALAQKGQFKWSWEKGGGADESAPADTSPAQDQDKDLLKENMSLREQCAQLSRFYDEAHMANSNLIDKIEILKQREKDLQEQVDRAVPSGNGGSSDQADLTSAVNENRTLKTEISQLQARLRTLESSPAAGSNIGSGSDLFKRMEKENAELRAELRELRNNASRITVEAPQPDDGGLMGAPDIRSLQREIERLRSDNALLRKVQKDLADRAVKGVELSKQDQELNRRIEEQESLITTAESQLKKLREERDAIEQSSKTAMAERDAEIERLRSDLYASRNQIAVAQQEAESFITERNNLYFDMAVLYIKGRMYRNAEREFLRLLEHNPDAADVHYNLGILYDSYLGDRRKAKAHYRKFLELAPVDEDANSVKAWLKSADEEY